MKKLTSKIPTKAQDTQTNLEVISESCKEEEVDDEEVKELDLEVEKALKQAAAEEKKGEPEVEVKVENNLMINGTYGSTYKEYKAVCHSFFIAKDNTEINWRRPYVQ